MKTILATILLTVFSVTSVFAYSITIPTDKWDKVKAQATARYGYPEMECEIVEEEQVCTPMDANEDAFTKRKAVQVLKNWYDGMKRFNESSEYVSDF